MSKTITDTRARFFEPAEVSEDGKKIVGYAIRYNSLSEDLGGFKEIIKKGSVEQAIRNNLAALYEHDLKKPLASLQDGTLKVEYRDDGIYYEIDLPDTTYANDLRNFMKKNPTSVGASFRMMGKIVDKWYKDAKNQVIRVIEKIEKIPEITVTLFPAYAATSAELRSQINESELTEIPADNSVELEYLQALQTLKALDELGQL